MNVFSWTDYVQGRSRDSMALTIGVFDGLHRGHQVLISRILARPLERPWIVTFAEHPDRILRTRDYPGDIMSGRQKIDALHTLGLDGVVIIDFSSDFSTLSGAHFFDVLMDGGPLAYVALGADFHCGYGMDTDALMAARILNARGVQTEIVAPVLDNGEPVSSTRIRNEIREARFSRAAALLGREYEIDLRGCALTEGAVDRGLIRQVLPKEGTYPVLVASDGGQMADRVTIGDSTLRLERQRTKVDFIRFGN